MTDPTGPGGADQPVSRPSAADRAAAIQAARARLDGGTDAVRAAVPPTQPPVAAPTLSHTSAAAAASPRTVPDSGRRPPRRQPAGRATRLALAGGAIGLSFGLVGVMSAASQEAAATPEPVVQRIVVAPDTATAAPTQIIVMLPQNVDTPVTTIEVPAVSANGTVTIPAAPGAPAPVASVAAPVAESSGS